MPELDRSGVTLAYAEAGDGNPPLVLLHGIACHRGFWASQLERLRADHRVVAVDLRGHGGSDAPVQPSGSRSSRSAASPPP